MTPVKQSSVAFGAVQAAVRMHHPEHYVAVVSTSDNCNFQAVIFSEQYKGRAASRKIVNIYLR